MPKFLIKANYTEAGIKGLQVEGGTGRREAVKAALEGLGGSLECFYYALGETDAYVIGDLPDVGAATALALSVNQGGGATVTTVALLTPEEVDAAAKLSVSYRAPGS
jgi:uncharacterized protein with GYD domain